MTSSAWSVGLLGLEGHLVEVEAAKGGGLPRTVLVGSPDKPLYEARDRVKAAIQGSGLSWPGQLVTINLTPAALPKSGTHYDLAIAAAVLAVERSVPRDLLATTVMLGELQLDGRVRAVRGVLPGLLAAVEAGMTRAIVPAAQVPEAELVEGLTIWGVETLGDLVDVLEGRPVHPPRPVPVGEPLRVIGEPDLADVAGQAEARFALEVAAAGRHHLLLHGAPGVGKSMLASRLPTILPDLTTAEALEVSAIHSLAGMLGGSLVTRPPYSDPLHNASLSSVVGGGQRIARPGSVSLAHRGVLFLDEAPEFGPHVLDALRTPLETGWATIARSQVTCRFPARFQLVLAANPCPCGNHGVAGQQCRCAPMVVRRYQERISGPIRDRIDVQQHLLPLNNATLKASLTRAEPSAAVAERVAEARQRQHRRLAELGFHVNGEVPGSVLRHHLPAPEGGELVDLALVRGQISARGVDKVVRIAWTLADLAGRDRISVADTRAALAMRRGDQEGVAA
ncbi:YifB family Mg chelatase-like AAA ATPase [Aestuariimicrobium soli]|uniref:YifB family Mg chelatase-like AAA ATPase n=1 Tax=Aestuariimicrobium soli TaxID=2035834 RepID=UPI003EB9C897